MALCGVKLTGIQHPSTCSCSLTRPTPVQHVRQAGRSEVESASGHRTLRLGCETSARAANVVVSQRSHRSISSHKYVNVCHCEVVVFVELSASQPKQEFLLASLSAWPKLRSLGMDRQVSELVAWIWSCCGMMMQVTKAGEAKPGSWWSCKVLLCDNLLRGWQSMIGSILSLESMYIYWRSNEPIGDPVHAG